MVGGGGRGGGLRRQKKKEFQAPELSLGTPAQVVSQTAAFDSQLHVLAYAAGQALTSEELNVSAMNGESTLSLRLWSALMGLKEGQAQPVPGLQG